MFHDVPTANLLVNLSVKEFWKYHSTFGEVTDKSQSFFTHTITA